MNNKQQPHNYQHNYYNHYQHQNYNNQFNNNNNNRFSENNSNENYYRGHHQSQSQQLTQTASISDLNYRFKSPPSSYHSNRSNQPAINYNNTFKGTSSQKSLTTVDEAESVTVNNNDLSKRSSSIESNESLNIVAVQESDCSNKCEDGEEEDEEEAVVTTSTICTTLNNNKIPLHSTWTFWHIKNDRLKNWKDNLIKLINFSYVEDFWSIYNYLVSPSSLDNGSDLALFKAGIEPMWEDPENKSGGRWLITFTSHSRKTNELDEIWLNTILALIGDSFCGLPTKHEDVTALGNDINENDDHICDNITGVCVQNRPKIDKLSVWTKNYKNATMTKYIGRKWKEIIGTSQTINFEPHNNQYIKGSDTKIFYKV